MKASHNHRGPYRKSVDPDRSWAEAWQAAKQDRELRQRTEEAMRRAGQQAREQEGSAS